MLCFLGTEVATGREEQGGHLPEDKEVAAQELIKAMKSLEPTMGEKKC